MSIIILAASAISFLAFRIFYFLGWSTAEVIAKGATSELFVIFALFCYFKNPGKSQAFRRYSLKMLCGLSVAVLADVAINLCIPAGIVTFMVMQLFFILAFREFKPFSAKYFVLTALVAAAFLAGDILTPFFNLKTLLLPLSIYTFFLIGSALKSLDSLRLPDKFARLVPLASLLFLASDFVLQFTLGDICRLPFIADQLASNLCHLLYYAAQFTFAFTLSRDFINS